MRALLAVLLCAAGRADDVCFDTGRGVTDAYGYGCGAVFYNPPYSVEYYCGIYDDDDFSAGDMCLSLIHI